MLNNKVISLLKYKLNKLDKKLGEQANTYDNLTESINNYNKEVEKFRDSMSKFNKQQYKDLMKLIGKEFQNIKPEPIFDWKRRKSTL